MPRLLTERDKVCAYCVYGEPYKEPRYCIRKRIAVYPAFTCMEWSEDV